MEGARSLMEVVVINGLDMHPVYVKYKKTSIYGAVFTQSRLSEYNQKCLNEMLLNLCGWDHVG